MAWRWSSSLKLSRQAAPVSSSCPVTKARPAPFRPKRSAAHCARISPSSSTKNLSEPLFCKTAIPLAKTLLVQLAFKYHQAVRDVARLNGLAQSWLASRPDRHRSIARVIKTAGGSPAIIAKLHVVPRTSILSLRRGGSLAAADRHQHKLDVLCRLPRPVLQRDRQWKPDKTLFEGFELYSPVRPPRFTG